VYEEVFESRLVRVTGIPVLTGVAGIAVHASAGNTSCPLGGHHGAVLRVQTPSGRAQGLAGAPVSAGKFSKSVVIGVPMALKTSS